jgi:hypothetical protein
MRHLVLSPDADSYKQSDGTEVTAIELEGGPSRYRRDMIGAPRMLDAQWTLTSWDYQYFRAFWNTAILRGVDSFTCDLLGDDGCGPVTHECKVVPGSMRVPSQVGLQYVVAAQLEVTPLPVDEVADAAVIAAYEGAH